MNFAELPRSDLETLARLIAVRIDPITLLDAADVGERLKCSAKYVLEQYMPRLGLPNPFP